MKTSSLVIKYFKKQSNKLFSSLEQSPDSFSENEFHKIRVTIKKMKALVTLLKKAYPPLHRKRYFAPFKTIFQQAGKIRDYHVQLDQLKSYPLNPSIEKFELLLARMIVEEKKKFFAMLNSDFKKELRKNEEKIVKELNHLDHKAATTFLHKEINGVLKILQSDQLKPAEVHELRKQIKDIYYLQKMMKPIDHDFVNTDQFQELLGKWHDGRILSQGLKDFIKSSNGNQAIVAPFDSLERKISENNDRLFQTILDEKSAVVDLIN